MSPYIVPLVLSATGTVPLKKNRATVWNCCLFAFVYSIRDNGGGGWGWGFSLKALHFVGFF